MMEGGCHQDVVYVPDITRAWFRSLMKPIEYDLSPI